MRHDLVAPDHLDSLTDKSELTTPKPNASAFHATGTLSNLSLLTDSSYGSKCDVHDNSGVNSVTRKRGILCYSDAENKRAFRRASMKPSQNNSFITDFNIRAGMLPQEHSRALALQEQSTFCNVDSVDDSRWQMRVCNTRYWLSKDNTTWILRQLSLFSAFIAPWQFSFEPTCESPGDRASAKVFKWMHLFTSVLYFVLSWQELWQSGILDR